MDASLNNYKGELAVLKAAELKKAGEKIIETVENNFKKALEFDPEYEKAKEKSFRNIIDNPCKPVIHVLKLKT